MHYYQHNIDEFRSLTINMSREARWIFRDMLDIIYRTEKPLPDDLGKICRDLGVRSDEEKAIVAEILLYEFEQVEGGYMHARVAEQISAYHAKADKARANGKSGGRRKTDPVKAETTSEPKGTDSVPSGFDLKPKTNPESTQPLANKELGTKNQEPEKSSARASRLPLDWKPSAEERGYCETQRPELDPERVSENFRDYWHAKAGKDACKLDWSAAWRSWVRNERAGPLTVRAVAKPAARDWE